MTRKRKRVGSTIEKRSPLRKGKKDSTKWEKGGVIIRCTRGAQCEKVGWIERGSKETNMTGKETDLSTKMEIRSLEPISKWGATLALKRNLLKKKRLLTKREGAVGILWASTLEKGVLSSEGQGKLPENAEKKLAKNAVLRECECPNQKKKQAKAPAAKFRPTSQLNEKHGPNVRQ